MAVTRNTDNIVIQSSSAVINKTFVKIDSV